MFIKYGYIKCMCKHKGQYIHQFLVFVLKHLLAQLADLYSSKKGTNISFTNISELNVSLKNWNQWLF